MIFFSPYFHLAKVSKLFFKRKEGRRERENTSRCASFRRQVNNLEGFITKLSAFLLLTLIGRLLRQLAPDLFSCTLAFGYSKQNSTQPGLRRLIQRLTCRGRQLPSEKAKLASQFLTLKIRLDKFSRFGASLSFSFTHKNFVFLLCDS